MGNTNFQTIYPMGGIVNGMVKQATGREAVDNLDMDYVTVAQNTVVGELEFTGDVVQFNTGRSVPIRKLEVSLELVQSGSGDPSPENVRPISGWDAVKVTRVGKNLADTRNINYTTAGIHIESDEQGIISLTGTRDSSSGWKTFKSITGLKPGTYVFSTNNNHVTCLLNYSQRTGSFTVSKGDVVRLALNNTSPGDVLAETGIQVQLEYGSTATDYEPYTGETITTEFPTPPGTVYGGTLDVVSGKLTVTKAVILITSANMSGEYNPETDKGNFWYTTLVALSTLNDGVICNRLKPVTNVSVNSSNGSFVWYTNGIIRWTEQRSMSRSDYIAWLSNNPLQIAYNLPVPQEYQLTPQEMNTLVGDNTIYSDAGTVDVMYWVYREMF